MLRFSSYTTCGFPTAVFNTLSSFFMFSFRYKILFWSCLFDILYTSCIYESLLFFIFCRVEFFYDPIEDLVFVIDWDSLLHMIWRLVLLMETTIPPCSRCVFFMCMLSGLMPSIHFSVLILHLWLNTFPLKDLPLNFLVGLLTFSILSLLQLKFSSVFIFLLNLVFKSWIIFIIYFSHMSMFFLRHLSGICNYSLYV